MRPNRRAWPLSAGLSTDRFRAWSPAPLRPSHPRTPRNLAETPQKPWSLSPVMAKQAREGPGWSICPDPGVLPASAWPRRWPVPVVLVAVCQVRPRSVDRELTGARVGPQLPATRRPRSWSGPSAGSRSTLVARRHRRPASSPDTSSARPGSPSPVRDHRSGVPAALRRSVGSTTRSPALSRRHRRAVTQPLDHRSHGPGSRGGPSADPLDSWGKRRDGFVPVPGQRGWISRFRVNWPTRTSRVSFRHAHPVFPYAATVFRHFETRCPPSSWLGLAPRTTYLRRPYALRPVPIPHTCPPDLVPSRPNSPSLP